MCLINQGLKYQGSTRWKFVEFGQLLRGDILGFVSPSFREFIWQKNNVSLNYLKGHSNFPNSQFGFHVFLFKQTAINAAKSWNGTQYSNNDYFIFKLHCSNFIDGGIIDRCDDYSDGKRGERWENAEVIGIFDIQGRDVTKTYEKYLL